MKNPGLESTAVVQQEKPGVVGGSSTRLRDDDTGVEGAQSWERKLVEAGVYVDGIVEKGGFLKKNGFCG